MNRLSGASLAGIWMWSVCFSGSVLPLREQSVSFAALAMLDQMLIVH